MRFWALILVRYTRVIRSLKVSTVLGVNSALELMKEIQAGYCLPG